MPISDDYDEVGILIAVPKRSLAEEGQVAQVLKSLYDIVGFDPCGINLTRPCVSGFASKLDEDVFAVEVKKSQLNMPVNVTESVKVDLEAQGVVNETMVKVDTGRRRITPLAQATLSDARTRNPTRRRKSS
ncbi:hypothetical protein OE88DRAFT_545379 [Heliocybe sulcata]|uniref:Uncharacterized protein n=1 Tax=Heliocybe sulcata TaxID=5364 RepID=A0A5C3MRN8_9AGAM|nr:hypothetical protein OE88DRAFT_545379 [Heliocybe sulcata]